MPIGERGLYAHEAPPTPHERGLYAESVVAIATPVIDALEVDITFTGMLPAVIDWGDTNDDTVAIGATRAGNHVYGEADTFTITVTDAMGRTAEVEVTVAE